MMIILEVKLPDIPGSLNELIKPISENSGNIYGLFLMILFLLLKK